MIVRCLYISVAILAVTVDCQAQVVINEVMFDPSGSEFFDEYIELYNVGENSVDLTGWRVGDMGESNVILGEEKVLSPGAYALVLDSGYGKNSTHYDPLPDTVLKLTVDSVTLGHNGLSNVRSEQIVLINASGDTVDVAVYQPGNEPGFSEEKIDARGGDGAGNWADAKWIEGTPGALNSVSAKARDLVLGLRSESPVHLPWGETAEIFLMVINVGRETVTEFVVEVNGEDFFTGSAISAYDSIQVTVPLFDHLHSLFEARVRFYGDQDPTNDTVTWTVIAGVPPGQVVISEVMARPFAGGTEWVELYNRSDSAVDLTHWSLSDLRTEARLAAGHEIGGLAYAIVAEDVISIREQFPDLDAPVFSLARWPRLNDGGDAIILRDVTGAVVDSIFYPGENANASLERVDVAAPGDGAQNWLLSQDSRGATPGAVNSVRFDADVAGITLVAEPNPFSEQVSITYRLPTPRVYVNLWVYDRSGRRIASLLEGVEGGSQRIVTWDGRAHNGQLLKPGIYVLYLEAGTAEGQLFRVRKPVILARGFNH